MKKGKVVLVGTGFVGMSMAYTKLNRGGVSELILIDINKDKTIGEEMDLNHGMPYAPQKMIIKAGDYSECKDAEVIVITAGIAQKPGQTRLELAETNAKIMKDITIKGANEIQALGGVETYQRRYLYMMAFDIIESDMFDATAGMTEEDRAKAYTFGRGKCQGKTILEVFESDPKYLQWCLDNGKNEEVKGYIELLTELKRTEVPETEEEQNEKLILINKFNFVSDEQKDEIFKKYNVTASQQLTLEQLREIFI